MKNQKNSTLKSQKNNYNVKNKKEYSNIDSILAYCGYKLDGKKIVSTAKYNPIPYEGI